MGNQSPNCFNRPKLFLVLITTKGRNPKLVLCRALVSSTCKNECCPCQVLIISPRKALRTRRCTTNHRARKCVYQLIKCPVSLSQQTLRSQSLLRHFTLSLQSKTFNTPNLCTNPKNRGNPVSRPTNIKTWLKHPSGAFLLFTP